MSDNKSLLSSEQLCPKDSHTTHVLFAHSIWPIWMSYPATSGVITRIVIIETNKIVHLLKPCYPPSYHLDMSPLLHKQVILPHRDTVTLCFSSADLSIRSDHMKVKNSRNSRAVCNMQRQIEHIRRFKIRMKKRNRSFCVGNTAARLISESLCIEQLNDKKAIFVRTYSLLYSILLWINLSQSSPMLIDSYKQKLKMQVCTVVWQSPTQTFAVPF